MVSKAKKTTLGDLDSFRSLRGTGDYATRPVLAGREDNFNGDPEINQPGLYSTLAFGKNASDVGKGATLEELLALQALKPGQPTADTAPDSRSWWDQIVQHGVDERARRTSEGVPPSEGFIDWNGLRYDLLGQRPGPIDITVPYGGPSKLAAPGEGLTLDQKLAMIKLGIDPESGLIEDPNNPGTFYRPDAAPTIGPLGIEEDTVAAPEQMGPLEGLAAGIEAEKRRLAGGDLSRWFQYPGMGGIEDAATVLPGQAEAPSQMTDEALYDANHPAQPAAKPTVWDQVVEGGGKLLEHTALGGAVKALFPDLWFGGGETMKGLGEGLNLGNSGTVTQGKNGPLNSITQQSDAWLMATGQKDTPRTSGSDDGSSYGQQLQGFIDLNHNGIDDRLEGYVPPPPTPPTGTPSPDQYDRYGSVVFPDMPPYDPGRDDEWLYFRKNMAAGGLVEGYAEGGEVSPMAGQDPRMEVIAEAEDALESIAEGEQPDEQAVAALKKFVEMFGDGALRQLNDNVKAGMKIRPGRGGGRMVEGPGGPTDDAIPAMIDGNQPAALSDGEFVLPAAAVEGAGGGDRERGAAALQELSDRLSGMRKGAAEKAG
ncbi:MAG: hypothetical protein WC829_10750 [Hyphomicrobium sp.]|jgi:hypothetical protein